MSMIFPIIFGLYIYENKTTKAIIYGLFSCIAEIMWLGCRSRAGLIGGFVATLLIIYHSRKHSLNILNKFIIIVPYLLIFVVMNQLSSGSLLNKVTTINPLIEQKFANDKSIDLEDIIIDEGIVKIIGKNYVLKIKAEDSKVIFQDDSNRELQTYIDNNVIRLNDPRYSNFQFYIDNKDKFNILYSKLNSAELDWYIKNNKISLIAQKGILYSKIKHPERIGFEGRERFGSGRGYIWSRTLPLIKNTFVIGNGPDTFPLYFPQYDMVGKIKYFGKTNIIVDKPHNYYLQLAVDTGVFSLLLMLIMFIMYLISSFRIYSNITTVNYTVKMGVIIFSSVCGYLVTAFFNDSVVSVAPVFWILFGTGISINHMIRNCLRVSVQ